MTDEQINKSIAEIEYEFTGIINGFGQRMMTHRTKGGWIRETDLPNYAGDLNAMHEAEKTLTDDQHRTFRSILFTAAYNCGTANTNDAAERQRISATAAQRAEAFCKVKGLWKEEA